MSIGHTSFCQSVVVRAYDSVVQKEELSQINRDDRPRGHFICYQTQTWHRTTEEIASYVCVYDGAFSKNYFGISFFAG